jgi:hypothetical protein
MFRKNPELAPHFLATLFHMNVPPHAYAVVVESSLDQLIPVEFRADLVLELRDANNELVLAIVLEVQRDKDPDKKYSWPVYVAVVRARKRCDTAVLVVATDAALAAWAAEDIDRAGLGTSRSCSALWSPEITDRPGGERGRFAVLSAVHTATAERHRRGPGGRPRARSARPRAGDGVFSNHLRRAA